MKNIFRRQMIAAHLHRHPLLRFRSASNHENQTRHHRRASQKSSHVTPPISFVGKGNHSHGSNTPAGVWKSSQGSAASGSAPARVDRPKSGFKPELPLCSHLNSFSIPLALYKDLSKLLSSRIKRRNRMLLLIILL